MQLGMPTLIELKSVEACAELCRSLGLRFIELNMNLPDYQADRLDAGSLGRIAAQYGIYYTIHLEENLNPWDFNDRVANAYLETVLETIAFAKRLRIPILNMHLSTGIYFTLPEKRVYLFEEYADK
jgi:sugar phosphate isomerase/epimerase